MQALAAIFSAQARLSVRLGRVILLVAGGSFLIPNAAAVPPLKPELLVALPESVATPDGMAIAPDGTLVVACPNFADLAKPACLARIDAAGHAMKWVEVPPLAKTGRSCPMGIEFGPDGDLYVCDNQGWPGKPEGAFEGRLLRLRIRDNRIESTTVVAQGMEHPNGVRVRGDWLYVTESLMTRVKDPSGLLVSAVYRFRLNDHDVTVTNTLADPQIVATFLSENRHCQYGADGLVFDRAGNLFVGIFGDGAIYKLTFDAAGQVASKVVFARTDHDYALDPHDPGFLAKATQARMRTTDGICVDEHDNLYVADFSNNAIARVSPAGEISVVAQNGDTDGRQGELNEPGEPIVWHGNLVVSNFDAVFGPDHRDKVNTRHDSPATLSLIRLQ